MAGFLVTETLDTEETKNNMYTKALEKFPRLRSTVYKSCGFYFWKEHPAEVAIGQVKKLDRKLKTWEELISYTEELFETKFGENDFQWFVEILEDY